MRTNSEPGIMISEETIERFFGYEDAFAHPFTTGAVIAITVALSVAPIVFKIFQATVGVSKNTYAELWARWRSWIWICLGLIIPILLGSAWVIAGVFILSLFCFREFARATGIFREKLIGLAAVLGLCLISFAVIDNFPRLFFAAPILGIGLIAIITIPQDRPEGFIQRVGLGIMGYLFFGFSLGYLALFTADPLYRPLLLLLLVTVELNDIFAFCCGRLFRGPKMTPNISPGKTISGALGALILTTTLVIALGHWVIFPGTPMDSWRNLLIMGFGISAFGQFGDLLLSSIKRDLGVKDLGRLLPGHGGLLDRFDSLIIVTPMYYHFLSLTLGTLAQSQPERIITGG
ncbi:MAG: phosphatidate cytidylyltransferase [Akkermansiaceae bacterium]